MQATSAFLKNNAQPPTDAELDAVLSRRWNKAAGRGLAPMDTPAPQTVAEWADENYYLSKQSSSIEGPWETLPYQKAMLNAMGDDDIEVVSIMKSARVGYTKMLCATIGYNIAHKNRNQLLYQPTDTDAKSFVQQEIDPMLADCLAVGGKLKGDFDKKGSHTTQSTKNFKGSILDIVGGKTPRNYRRYTKDTVMYDELGAFDGDIGGEGSPTSLGDVRVETSSFPKSIRGSSPKIKGLCQMEASLEEADKVFQRHLPCPHCQTLIVLKWGDKQFKWTDKDAATTLYFPECCGASIHYGQYAAMDENGVWISGDGTIIDENDNHVLPNGEIVPPPRHIGFKIWSAYSYFKTWSQLVTDFLNADKARKAGNHSKLKSFINTKLGETWEETGVGIKEDALESHKDEYSPATLPPGILLITAGADVQDDRIECEICGYGVGEESWSISYNVIYGDPETAAVWDRFEDLLAEKYNVAGVEIGIARTFLDSGAHTRAVERFCRRKKSIKNGVYAIKGHSVAGKPVMASPLRIVKAGTEFKPTMIGTDTGKEAVYGRLAVDEPGPGYCHFPDYYDSNYFKMLTSEEKLIRLVRGQRKIEWKLKSGVKRNEALDCRNYNYAAMVSLNARFNIIATRYKKRRAALKKTPAPVLIPDPTPATTGPEIEEQVETKPPEHPAPKIKKRRKRPARPGNGWFKRN